MHYDYDPFSNHGNAPQHGADAQVTQVGTASGQFSQIFSNIIDGTCWQGV